MSPSLHALLQNLIDYAGLFPPAQLPLDQSIKNYISYVNGPDNWMLGRFICPTAKFADLAGFADVIGQAKYPLRLSALGRGGPDSNTFLEGLRQDLADISALRQALDQKVIVDVYEVRLPSSVLTEETAQAAWELFGQADRLLVEHGPPSLTPFYEVPLSGDKWFAAPVTAAIGLSRLKQQQTDGITPSFPPGLKLRCGGLEAAAFPSPEQVAAFLDVCRKENVPLKCTAGLHHPIRHYNESVKTKMHGFLNIFVAGVLAHCNPIDSAQLLQIIEDEVASRFVFNDQGLHWRHHHATIAGIRQARRQAVISFGSCSFDEPLADLRSLGLL